MLLWATAGTYPIVGLMFGSKLSSTNLQTILDFPTPVSCRDKIKRILSKHGQKQLLDVYTINYKNKLSGDMPIFLPVCARYSVIVKT